MANRRWMANEQLKVNDNTPRPKPGVGGMKATGFTKESPVPYPGAPGPKGPGWKPARIGFNEVKTHVKQDLADDIYGQDPALIGQRLMTDRMPVDFSGMMPMGQRMPPDMMPVEPPEREIPIGRRPPSGIPPGGGMGIMPIGRRLPPIFKRRSGGGFNY